MRNSSARVANFKRCAHSELAPLKGQRTARLPTLDLVEQSTTAYIGKVQYLIRAYIQLKAPINVFPFEITQIVPFGCKQQFRWRVPAGSVKLYVAAADNFRASDMCLKNWASAFLQSQGVG
jgi:hypothetical protein